MFTLGIDYGTNSVRALVVRCADGAELGSCVVNYPSGSQGDLLDSRDHHLARQHPGDYLFGLEKSVKGAIAAAKRTRGFEPAKIIGIGVDTTGSSPIPVDARNVPLALNPRWKKNLHAQCWLWKDHTGWREAAQITALTGPRITIGLDPGIRTGVKVAVVDKTGKLVDTATIYPHEPRRDWEGALAILCQLAQKHSADLIAIGNGTASRETDKLAADLI